MSEHDGPGPDGRSTSERITAAADKIAQSVRDAVTDGVAAVRPAWEDKVKPAWEEKVVPTWEDTVAPAIATGADKVAEWGDDVRSSADRKSEEVSAGGRPSDKILGGALGVGAAAVALGTGAARWISKEAGQVGHHDDGGTDAAGPSPDPGSSAPPTPTDVG